MSVVIAPAGIADRVEVIDWALGVIFHDAQ
jgi:hypothetical protein